MDPTPAPLIPQDGWHCLHLFYRIEYGQWQLLNTAEQRAAKIALSTLVQETRALESTQLLTLSQVTPKADLGFMLVTPDLQTANRIEKQLTLSLGADVLVPVYSYLSLTEESEYTTTDEQYAATLETEQKLKRDTPEFEKALQDFRERMKKYRQERVYTDAARLAGGLFLQHDEARGRRTQLVFAPLRERRVLMGGHARVGRQYAGKVKASHHRLDRPRRCRMGCDPFRARYFQIQSDRVPNALR
jgi:chlorite dismutase